MKRWSKRLLAGLIGVMMLILMTVPAFASGQTAAECRNGVVRIVAIYEADLYNPDSGAYVGSLDGYSRGSAFGVGDAGKETDVFITNRHVVALEDELVTLDGTAYYATYNITGYYILLDDYAYNTQTFTIDTSRAVPCTVIYLGADDDADVAVLRGAEKVPGRVALTLQDEESSLEVGDTVSALGFPGSSDGATSEGYMLATVDDVTVTSGVVSRFFDSVSVTADSGGLAGRLIQSTASINSGNSGGPLIDENGAVVGINTYTYHGGSDAVTNAYYALRVQYAKDALDRLGIDYDVSGSGIGTGTVVIVAVILAALIMAVLLVVRKRKGAKAVEREKVAVAQRTAGLETEQTASAVTSGAASGDSGYRIQGVSGVLEGKRFLISSQGPVILGRDPERCGVVFPADTPGVSGRHCAVWFDNGSVYIKDLGSTHGTFLTPGRRLAANQAVQVRPGEAFFLGSQEQSFVIAERRP